MKRRLALWGLVVGLALQFGVLATMIARRELALRHGSLCRFRTAPVDPYDAFRGRYVALDIETLRGGVSANRRYARGEWVCARVVADTNGFSVIDRLAARSDGDGVWMRLRVRSSWEEHRQPRPARRDTGGLPVPEPTPLPTGRYRAQLDVPFDRYYLEERLAPEAEQAYREASRASARREAVARVRVWRGLAVLEGVEIDGVPIRELARRRLDAVERP